MKKYSVTLDTLNESGVYPAWGECETIEIECNPSDLEKEIETLKKDFCHSLVANENYEFSDIAGFDLVKSLSKENVLLKVEATWEEIEDEDEDEEIKGNIRVLLEKEGIAFDGWRLSDLNLEDVPYINVRINNPNYICVAWIKLNKSLEILEVVKEKEEEYEFLDVSREFFKKYLIKKTNS